MIKIEFNNIEYDLPTRFSEIKIGTYMKVSDLDKDLSDSDRLAEIIHIFTEIPVEDIKNINIDQIVYISNALKFLFENTNRLLIDQIKIDDTWYGLNKHLGEISFGEYIDLEELSKGNTASANLPFLMAILYRPLKRKHKLSKFTTFLNKYIYNKEIDSTYEIEDYNGDDVKERANLFEEKLSVEVALGALFFFMILRVILTENIQNSSDKMKMLKEMMKKLKLTFQSHGDG